MELRDLLMVIKLCELLASQHGSPWTSTRHRKIESRELICRVAIANGLDLSRIKVRGFRMMMGRPLLTVWLEIYEETFGPNSTFGTAAERELIRRNIKSNLQYGLD